MKFLRKSTFVDRLRVRVSMFLIRRMGVEINYAQIKPPEVFVLISHRRSADLSIGAVVGVFFKEDDAWDFVKNRDAPEIFSVQTWRVL